LQTQLRYAERNNIADRHFCRVFELVHFKQASMRTMLLK
jgi:hypothetical protein